MTAWGIAWGATGPGLAVLSLTLAVIGWRRVRAERRRLLAGLTPWPAFWAFPGIRLSVVAVALGVIALGVETSFLAVRLLAP
jgi:hypothetical protein